MPTPILYECLFGTGAIARTAFFADTVEMLISSLLKRRLFCAHWRTKKTMSGIFRHGPILAAIAKVVILRS